MFFEIQHSKNDAEFSHNYMDNITYPLHIHRSFEFFAQIKGTTQVVIDEKKYELNEGESVLIFPFQTHSYTTITKGKCLISIFSSDVVATYSKNKATLIPTNNYFLYDAPNNAPSNAYLQKALAYDICGKFDIERNYKPREKDLFHQSIISLLIYAEENYKSNCLLEDACKTIGYDYAYVSKKFKKTIGVSFKKYINNLRIILAKHLLSASNKSISDVVSECGFNSARAFNIEFKNQVGITPTEYKRKIQTSDVLSTKTSARIDT